MLGAVNRIEIEIKLNRDRSWLLETLSKMSEEDMQAPRTQSEHDPKKYWSYADHFVHTTLIERNWNQMFRRHLDGKKGMTLGSNPDGSRQSTEEIMAGIHRWTEEWADENRGKPFDELVRIGLEVRSETLAYLASLTQEQLDSKIPGAPWADGTVGGIMAANAEHGRMHYGYAEAGETAPAT
ncbi:MAG: DinB family protein [Acidimicrobiales bacterium]